MELLSEVSPQNLPGALDASGSLFFLPSGEVLFVVNSNAARLSQFNVDNNGALSFRSVTELASIGASLSSVRHLATNSSGTVLYVAGEHRLATLNYNRDTGAVSLATEVLVDADLTITDLALSADDRHLYVVSNNFPFDTNSGSSSLTRFRIDAATGVPALDAVRTEPNSNAPLASINLPPASDLVFLGKRTELEVSRRNADTGELTLLSTNDGVPGGESTADGSWLFPVLSQGFDVYSVDTSSGEIVRTQSFRVGVPPLRQFSAFVQGAFAMSRAEDRLFLTGSILIGARLVTSSDVFVREPTTGFVRRDGTGLRPANSMVRHPVNDWFYTYVPGRPQIGLVGASTGLLSQLGLLPPLPETNIVSAVLPGSRSENTGTNAAGITAFATVLNSGSADAVGCRAGILPNYPAELQLVTFESDPVTNDLIGGLNDLFEVPAGGAANLVLRFSTSLDDVEFSRIPQLLVILFICDNTRISKRVTGVTTFGFASDDLGLPDLLVATASPDRPGVVTLPTVSGQSFFTVATVNLSSSALITAKGAVELAGSIAGADPLDDPAALNLLICETNPNTSQCKAPFSDQVERTIDENEVVTYTVVVQGLGSEVPFCPETNRAFVLFQDVDGLLRGSSSVAVEALVSE